MEYKDASKCPHGAAEDAIAAEIVVRLLSVDYESIMTIDAKTGAARPYMGTSIDELIAEQERVQSSIIGQEAYLRARCANDDVERIIRETSLPYIKQRLETAPSFSTAYSLRRNGGIVHQRALYTYLDKSQEQILCAIQDITEFYNIENVKRDQIAAALQTLQELGGMNLARYDLKSRTFYSNSDMATRVGYGEVIKNVPEEFIENGLVAPVSAQEYRDFFARLRAGEGGSLTAACRVADGGFHWMHIDARIIFDRDNKPYQAIMSFKDVDEQREQAAVYKKWRQSIENRKPGEYTLFRSNLSKGISFDRIEGSLLKLQRFSYNLETINDRARDYAGKFVHIDDFDAYVSLVNSENLIAGYYRGVRMATLDYRERVNDDEYRWLRVSAETSQYPDSTDVELFLLFEPISSEEQPAKKPERSAKKREKAQHRLLLENTGAAMMKCDWKTRTFTYTPEVSQHLFGRYDDRPVWEIFMADKVADTQDIKALSELAQSIARSPDRTSGTMELMLKTPSRASHWFMVHIFKQMDGSGETSGIVLAFLDVNEDALSNKKLHFQAEHDSLTGLYNRASFLKLVSETVRGKPEGSYILLCCDINDFRFINERFGHGEGDELLQFSAEKLRAIAEQKGGFAGRLSNDVYAMLLPNEDGMLQRASDIIRDYFNDYPLKAKITGRAGAYIIIDPCMTADAMLDLALTAKESIRGKFAAWLAIYEDSMNEGWLREKSIADRMEAALESGQFDVYIQPQFHHATGRIVGAEALARWIDPERGVIPPMEFIPVFEKNGFIARLDEYVWEKAARYVADWMARGNTPVPVSVNVSREDLNDPELCRKLLEIVESHNIPVNLFRLEITESIFVEDTERIVSVVEKLHSAGFLIEMDDFGSGYSSLNILKDVPVDVLKLDMKFFSGDDNLGRGGMIINAVLRMARWLNIPAIAEGVESKAQADFLLGVGCPTIQGFLYEKPMPAADFERLLAAGIAAKPVEQNIIRTELDTNSFWNPLSGDSQFFNNYIGPAVVFEYHNGEYELMRVNARFVEAMRLTDADVLPAFGMINLYGEDKPKFMEAVLEAIRTGCDAKADVRFASGAASLRRYCVTLRVIAQSVERALIFAALEA